MADTKGKAARFMLIKLLTEGMVTSSEIEAAANVKSDAINKNFNKIKQWLAPMEITVQSFNDHDRIFRLNTAPKTIDFRRTLIIAKIIIASRAFSKADLSAVIKGLMAPFKVVNKDELFKVLLKPSRDEYQPVQSLVDVNIFETICHALSDQHVLKIVYQDAHGQVAQRELDPLSIDFNDHYFYLRAILYNVPEKANNIRNYRIDRIQQASLTSLPIDCDPDAIETSRSANINSLANMFGSINGTVEKIVFRCARRIIEPSLDKFPYAAKVYHENDLTAPIYDARKQESFDFDQLAADEENVVIETHVANIQGALIWLLSAGSQVKILEPTALVYQIKTELQNALNNYK